jgi:L-fuculose-phosphate aldolase
MGRRMYSRGLIAGEEGNISARLQDGLMLITPSGVCKGTMQPDDLAIIDENGKWLAGLPASVEWKMHRAIYAARGDVSAIVHAHPPKCIALSLCFDVFQSGLSLLPKAAYSIGKVALSPFMPIGSADLAESAAEEAADSNAIILERHGTVTLGKTPVAALNLSEGLESCAEIALALKALGRI